MPFEFNTKNDIFFMKMALDSATKALAADEVPIGAVVVAPDGNTVLAEAYNLVEQSNCQSAHAEVAFFGAEHHAVEVIDRGATLSAGVDDAFGSGDHLGY